MLFITLSPLTILCTFLLLVYISFFADIFVEPLNALLNSLRAAGIIAT